MLEFFLGCYFLIAFGQVFPPDGPHSLELIDGELIHYQGAMYKYDKNGNLSPETKAILDEIFRAKKKISERDY